MTRAAVWMATLGPVGLWPWGPGTLASAIVVAVWWLWGASPIAWGIACVFIVALGIVASGVAEAALGSDDGRIVIDEVAGQALALALAPQTLAAGFLAFFLFRLFDIAKPPPIGRLQHVHGGWGIVLDDVVAALPVAVVLGAWSAFA